MLSFDAFSIKGKYKEKTIKTIKISLDLPAPTAKIPTKEAG